MIFLLCCQTGNLNSFEYVYIIKQNGNLFEKRYVENQKTICIVNNYVTEHPKDSTKLNYNVNGDLISAETYSFIHGEYQRNILKKAEDYYLQAFSNDSDCVEKSIIQHRFLIEESINNICNIQNSVLPKTGDISLLKKINQNNDTILMSYAGINSIFNSPYDIFQLYFYNQSLINFDLQVKNGYLLKEHYCFSNGTLIRRYFYNNNGKLNKSVTDISYDNQPSQNIIRTYTSSRK